MALLAGFLNFSGHSNLICFVVDNSHFNSEYFNLGKVVLGEKLRELNSENNIVLSWFLDQPPTESVSEIVQAVNYRYLAAANQFFTSQKNAASQLTEIPLTAGAPLCEAIWANYLFAKEKNLDKFYKNNMLVIITQGEGNLTSNEMDCFLCCQDEFTNFFDTVALVNLGGRDSNILTRQISNCNNPLVKDAGLSRQSISKALDEILATYKTDRYFMPWTGIIVFIFWMVILLLQPKKG